MVNVPSNQTTPLTFGSKILEKKQFLCIKCFDFLEFVESKFKICLIFYQVWIN